METKRWRKAISLVLSLLIVNALAYLKAEEEDDEGGGECGREIPEEDAEKERKKPSRCLLVFLLVFLPRPFSNHVGLFLENPSAHLVGQLSSDSSYSPEKRRTEGGRFDSLTPSSGLF